MQTRGRGGGGRAQGTLFNHRDIQWTPLQRRVKYNHKNTLVFSLTPWVIVLHLCRKKRKRTRQSDMHLPSPLWLSSHIDRLLRG